MAETQHPWAATLHHQVIGAVQTAHRATDLGMIEQRNPHPRQGLAVGVEDAATQHGETLAIEAAGQDALLDGHGSFEKEGHLIAQARSPNE